MTDTDSAGALTRLSRLVSRLRQRHIADPETRELIGELDEVIGATQAGAPVSSAPSSERWRLLFEAAPDAYVVTDRAGMVVSSNPRAVEMLGLHQIIDRRVPLVLRIARSDRPEFHRLLRSGIPSSEKPVVALERPEESEFRVEVQCVEAGPDELLWILHDVSEAERGRRLLEAAASREHAAAEQLRVVDSMRKAFLLAVSHDLRSPLVAIAEFASLLQDDRLGDGLRDSALERLRATARETIAMLNGLLDYERIEHAAVTVRRDDVDAADVVRRVVESIPSEGHEVHFDLRPSPAAIDSTIAERIVTNLVRNAIQHTPPGTSIWVGCRLEPDGVLITVDDAGPGIPAADRQAVFELFHRRRPADTVGGLGIGLALVRRFAQLHGGYARAEDRPGGGTSFQVVLGAIDSSPERHQD